MPCSPETQWPTISFSCLIRLKHGFSRYAQGCLSSPVFNLTQSCRTRESLGIIRRCRRQRRISHKVLLDTFDAPFHQMFASGYDQSMITMTRFDIDSFDYKLGHSAPLYYAYTPCSDSGLMLKLNTLRMPDGLPRSVTAAQALGLVLTWFCTRRSMMSFCLIFVITGSVCLL